MEPIKFKEQTAVLAENQDEYKDLPIHEVNDPTGEIVFCWKMSWKDRIRVLFTGVIWHQVMTFKRPLQPQLLSSKKPYMNTDIHPRI